MKYAIGIAQKLGITHLVVTSGLQAAGKSYDEQWASLTEGVKRAGDLAGTPNLPCWSSRSIRWSIIPAAT